MECELVKNQAEKQVIVMALAADSEKKRPIYNGFRARATRAGNFWLDAIIVGFFLPCLIFLLGCESLNQDQNNKRWWFPSLQTPGHLNPDHELYTPEGSDPFMDPTIGPKSLQSRPPGYEVPRSRVQQLMDSQPKK